MEEEFETNVRLTFEEIHQMANDDADDDGSMAWKTMTKKLLPTGQVVEHQVWESEYQMD